MISVRSLRVDYEGVTAVRDLSFEVEGGQVFGLVGPNGAGKTSTLKALAGIVSPTYGDIVIDGVDLELDLQKALVPVGYMPDFPPVYENLTVAEYLEVFAAAYFCPRGSRLSLAKKWVDKVRLEDKWRSPIKTLSRGMRQRLVLAKTLLHDPKVLLLDEPASGLDPVGRVEMRDVLRDVAASGKSVIISSHILTELSDICHAAGVMEKGQMVVSGSIDEIRQRINMPNEIVLQVVGGEEGLPQRITELLQGLDLTGEVLETSSQKFRFSFSGGEREAADILAKLVHEGITVAGFYVKKADLEDIFMKVGAKETS